MVIKKPRKRGFLLFGLAGGIRTPDRRIRNPMLYPTELQPVIYYYTAYLMLGQPVNIINQEQNMDFFKLVADVGFPIAAAIAAGYFVFLTLKFILAGVTSSVNGMGGIIKGLDARVDTMTNDLQRVDVKISHALGLQPDYYRISRAEQIDQRKD